MSNVKNYGILEGKRNSCDMSARCTTADSLTYFSTFAPIFLTGVSVAVFLPPLAALDLPLLAMLWY